MQPFLVHIRCDADGFTHAVTEDEFATGRHQGRFRAICGHEVLAAPMTEAPGRFDPTCRGLLSTDPPPVATVPPQQRRRTRWRARR